jgi:hypothetical protein
LSSLVATVAQDCDRSQRWLQSHRSLSVIASVEVMEIHMPESV